MLYHLVFWILRNTIARTVLLFGLAAAAIVGGFGMADEAVKYKRGAQAVSLETLPKTVKYDYVKLDTKSDGYYVYMETTNEKTKAKDYTLFYPVYNSKDYRALESSRKPHITAVVKHTLAQSQEGCIKLENCLETGAMPMQGRLTLMPFDVSEYTDDSSNRNVLNLLEEDYTLDGKTVYLDADWVPSTSQGAGTVQLIGLGLLVAAFASFGIPMLLRRRATAAV
jgi:hypothetical protein